MLVLCSRVTYVSFLLLYGMCMSDIWSCCKIKFSWTKRQVKDLWFHVVLLCISVCWNWLQFSSGLFALFEGLNACSFELIYWRVFLRYRWSWVRSNSRRLCEAREILVLEDFYIMSFQFCFRFCAVVTLSNGTVLCNFIKSHLVLLGQLGFLFLWGRLCWWTSLSSE